MFTDELISCSVTALEPATPRTISLGQEDSAHKMEGQKKQNKTQTARLKFKASCTKFKKRISRLLHKSRVHPSATMTNLQSFQSHTECEPALSDHSHETPQSRHTQQHPIFQTNISVDNNNHTPRTQEAPNTRYQANTTTPTVRTIQHDKVDIALSCDEIHERTPSSGVTLDTCPTRTDEIGTLIISSKSSIDDKPIHASCQHNFTSKYDKARDQLVMRALCDKRQETEAPKGKRETRVITIDSSSTITESKASMKTKDKSIITHEISDEDDNVELHENSRIDKSNSPLKLGHRSPLDIEDKRLQTLFPCVVKGESTSTNFNWKSHNDDRSIMTETKVEPHNNTAIQGNQINDRFIALLEKTGIPLVSNVTNISVQGNICGFDFMYLIDTGASICAIHSKLLRQIPTLAEHTPLPTTISSIKSVSGETIPVQGQIEVPFRIGNNLYLFKALVIERMAYDVILGRDFLAHYNAKIDLEHHVLTLDQAQFPFDVSRFADPDDSTDTNICFVHAKSSFVIPPSTEIIIPGDPSQSTEKGTTGIVETRQDFVDRYQIVGATELVSVWDNTVPIRLLNPTNQPVWIYRRTRLGQMTFVDPGDIATFDLHKSDLEAEAAREIPAAVDRDVPIPRDIHTDGLRLL